MIRNKFLDEAFKEKSKLAQERLLEQRMVIDRLCAPMPSRHPSMMDVKGKSPIVAPKMFSCVECGCNLVLGKVCQSCGKDYNKEA